MTYKTVLVHLDHGRACARRVVLACALARDHAAHLIGIAPIGLLPPYFADDPESPRYRRAAQVRRDLAGDVTSLFEEQARRTGVSSFESRIVEEDAADTMALHGRYADVSIVGQFDPSDPTTHAQFAEQVFLRAGRPTIVVPWVGTLPAMGTDVLIAWNATRDAARAVSDALPLLRRARRVRLLVLNAIPSWEGHGEDPGADMALFLSRHRIAAEVIQDRSFLATGDAIVSRAADDGCDLLVMGGYGTSRFREVVLGGVTRTVLDSTTVPVLISHH